MPDLTPSLSVPEIHIMDFAMIFITCDDMELWPLFIYCLGNLTHRHHQSAAGAENY